jgi:hypothetical protein
LLDYIETMKEQLRVKDGQIESHKQQLDAQSDLNRRASRRVAQNERPGDAPTRSGRRRRGTPAILEYAKRTFGG